MSVEFLVNARLSTLSAKFERACHPDGYLVAPSYLSRGLRAALAGRSRPGSELLIDDGLFDDIARISKQFGTRAEAVALQMRTKGIDPTAPPARTALPASLRTSIDSLASDLEAASAKVTPFEVSQQLALNPTAIVGVENILGALWRSAGLEVDLVENGRKRIRELNRNNAAMSADNVRLAALHKVRDLPVVSAVDYDTAYDAGRVFARHDVKSVAIPFGAFMGDNSSTKSAIVRNRRIDLGSSMPLRIVRCVAVAKGFSDGWHASRSDHPQQIHLLGLGQPLILGLVSMVFAAVPLVTSDSTSPIKDAVSGSIYSDVPVFRRLKCAFVVRHYLLTGKGGWQCPCLWCRAAPNAKSWATSRRWARAHPEIPWADPPLRRGSFLSGELPYFSLQPSAEVLEARIGHNHWVVARCVRRLARAAKTDGGLARLVKSQLDDYPVGPANEAFARGLRFAYKFVSNNLS